MCTGMDVDLIALNDITIWVYHFVRSDHPRETRSPERSESISSIPWEIGYSGSDHIWDFEKQKWPIYFVV